MNNPLLSSSPLPLFSAIKPEHIFPAIEKIINENRQEVAKLVSDCKNPTWENLIYPLELLDKKLNDAWSPIGHTKQVMNSPALREAYEKCLPLLSEYGTEMGQNKELYSLYKKISASNEFATYSPSRKKIIQDALRDFKLSGIALPPEKQKQFGELRKKLSELSSKFSNNVLDATMSWSKLITDVNELKGIPENTLQGYAEAAKKKEKSGWLLTLNGPSYIPLITYCENRQLRQEIYEASNTRASDQGPDAKKFDNTPTMEEILKFRHELAKLLDFNNYAELSIATKMAKTTAEVLSFLNDLAEKSYPQGVEELKALKEFAKENLNLNDLKSWDVPFVAEKLRQHRYNISQEEVRPYFAAEKVIQGMFEIVNRIFGLTFEQVKEFDSWHPDALFYKVKRDGKHIASFFFDLYARENKQGGAWMDSCRSRMKTDDGIVLPVAYLVCNFSGPIGNKPALITHDDVVTLFHEFGHGLHHMLTEVNELGASGIAGVAWDAVELPSQIMENWCWEKAGLEILAEHYETGEKLPEEMINKLLKAKNFGTAMALLRQIELALFDFELHTFYATEKYQGIQKTLDSVRQRVVVLQPPAINRFQNSFSHIFAGGYAAGYYSYKWAEVLSADAFSKFEEKGIFDRSTGLEFVEAVLSKGGSEDIAELFVNFRGRPPKIAAFLRHQGIKA
jgi:oligopeptidase A